MLWNDPGESAPGEDKFLAILFKNCKLTLTLPLFLIWDFSFQNSRIESCNLSSIAAPIFKVESNLKPLNYPPVSLTSHIITIFKGFSKKRKFHTWRPTAHSELPMTWFPKGLQLCARAVSTLWLPVQPFVKKFRLRSHLPRLQDGIWQSGPCLAVQ